MTRVKQSEKAIVKIAYLPTKEKRPRKNDRLVARNSPKSHSNLFPFELSNLTWPSPWPNPVACPLVRVPGTPSVRVILERLVTVRHGWFSKPEFKQRQAIRRTQCLRWQSVTFSNTKKRDFFIVWFSGLLKRCETHFSIWPRVRAVF